MSEHDICLLILFLGLFVESVDHVEHGVAGYHVVARLGAALGVDRAVDVREVAQEVVSGINKAVQVPSGAQTVEGDV